MLVSTPSDWIILDVPAPAEAQAKEIRAQRDARYKNLYQEASTDARWVGDLGEIMLNGWLAAQGLEKFSWLQDDAAGKPDFITEKGAAIGAKTVKRKVPPQLHYTAQVTARHAKEPSNWFFFMNYIIEQKKLWLLGAIESDRFLKQATYYPAGSQVHSNYAIRQGHEIYNIELSRLIQPAAWLKMVA